MQLSTCSGADRHYSSVFPSWRCSCDIVLSACSDFKLPHLNGWWLNWCQSPLFLMKVFLTNVQLCFFESHKPLTVAFKRESIWFKRGAELIMWTPWFLWHLKVIRAFLEAWYFFNSKAFDFYVLLYHPCQKSWSIINQINLISAHKV